MWHRTDWRQKLLGAVCTAYDPALVVVLLCMCVCMCIKRLSKHVSVIKLNRCAVHRTRARHCANTAHFSRAAQWATFMFIIMVAADWAQGFRSPIARVYNMRSVPIRLASKGASNFVVMDKLNEIMQFFELVFIAHAVDWMHLILAHQRLRMKNYIDAIYSQRA